MKFIVDADIIRSAGYSEHPVSSTSRTILNEIKDSNSNAVYCSTLMKEWKKHRSTYSTKWIATMMSKKRLLFIASDIEAKVFLENLENSKEKNIALKDVHLIDLAIASDKIIFSNDLNAKNAFSNLLDKRHNFKNIYWLSPKKDIDIILQYALKSKIIHDECLMV